MTDHLSKIARYLLVASFICGLQAAKGQYVPTHIRNEGIYEFLDELATGRIIDLNSMVKPYSRMVIAQFLSEAESKRSQLNQRQMKELDFYLLDYGKELPSITPPSASWLWQNKNGPKRFDLFYYRDTLFRITVNPILGTDVWNNENGTFYHWWNGVEANASIGKFGFWASWRDNHESVELTSRDFMNQRTGSSVTFISNSGAYDYEEFRGGVTYDWNWGHAGLIIDQFEWGENNYGSNILSGRTPAFTRLELSITPVDWFSFEYVHGFINSEVVDSLLSFYVTNGYGTDYREVYHPKFLAANLFTFRPVPGTYLSVGNSLIIDSRTLSPSFLIPIAFFRAIDRNINTRIDAMNAQIFLAMSSRTIRYLHLYGSFFIDELQVGRLNDPNSHNFFSFKGGVSSTILPNTKLVAEYTWTNCLTFRHNVPTTTFESNMYNLGHYLEDNAKDLYLAAEYRPWRTLSVKAYLNHSIKGPDHTDLGTEPRDEIEPFSPVVWESSRLGILGRVQIINDLYVRLGYQWRNVTGEQEYIDRWTPEVYHGKTGTFLFGINYGF